MIRAVLDANVFVSALIRPEGPPGKIFAELVERKAFALVLSPAIAAEIRQTLGEARVKRYLRLTDQETEAWLASVQSLSEMVEGVLSVSVVTADADDDKYFAAALEAEADFLVSGDKHVIEIGEYERIRVVTPRAFLEKIT